MNTYIFPNDFDINALSIHTDPKRKAPFITYGDNQKAVAFVTPAATTKYPRVTGDGNFHENNPFCPPSIDKASYTLDLQHFMNEKFGDKFVECIESIDEKVLQFFHDNQKALLKRENLSLSELKMLQHRNVKVKDGEPCLSLSCRKFYTDSVGNKRERKPLICDNKGGVIPGGNILPGDVVRATMTTGSIWVVNSKFGLHWELGDLSLVTRPDDEPPMNVSAFNQPIQSTA